MSRFTDIALPLAARGHAGAPGGKESLLKGKQLLATGPCGEADP